MSRLLLVICLLALALPAASEAYVVGGRPWPDAGFSYHVEAGSYSAAVDRAARIVNRAGVGVRLRRTNRFDADVVVVKAGPRCWGSAPVGFRRFRRAVVSLGPRCPTGLVTLTAVHEFLHVLGLDHEGRACARMNEAYDQSGTPSRCRRRGLRYWLARPLTPDDRRGMRALYG